MGSHIGTTTAALRWLLCGWRKLLTFSNPAWNRFLATKVTVKPVQRIIVWKNIKTCQSSFPSGSPTTCQQTALEGPFFLKSKSPVRNKLNKLKAPSPLRRAFTAEAIPTLGSGTSPSATHWSPLWVGCWGGRWVQGAAGNTLGASAARHKINEQLWSCNL